MSEEASSRKVVDTLGTSYKAAWRRRIADDLAAGIVDDHVPNELPEINRFLGQKGLRELRELIERAVQSAPDERPFEIVANSMYAYSQARPGVACATFRALGDREAASRPETVRFKRAVLNLLFRQNIASELAEDVLRSMRGLVWGFIILEIASNYWEASDYERSFEIAVGIFSRGLDDLLSGRNEFL